MNERVLYVPLKDPSPFRSRHTCTLVGCEHTPASDAYHFAYRTTSIWWRRSLELKMFRMAYYFVYLIKKKPKDGEKETDVGQARQIALTRHGSA